MKSEKILKRLRKTLDDIGHLRESRRLYKAVLAQLGESPEGIVTNWPESTPLEQLTSEIEGLIASHEEFEDFWRTFKSEEFDEKDPRNIFVGYESPITDAFKLRMKVDDFFGYDY